MHRPQLKEKAIWSELDHIQASTFGLRAATALGISVIADALDYAAAPIFALPIIGDIADVFLSGILYSITKSKKAAVINAIEFIPVVGDFIPAYTISTLMWIHQESSKRKKMQKMRKETITADQGRNLGTSSNGIPIHLGNKIENDDPDPSGRRTDSKEEIKMRKLVASRYARLKDGRYL